VKRQRKAEQHLMGAELQRVPVRVDGEQPEPAQEPRRDGGDRLQTRRQEQRPEAIVEEAELPGAGPRLGNVARERHAGLLDGGKPRRRLPALFPVEPRHA